MVSQAGSSDLQDYSRRTFNILPVFLQHTARSGASQPELYSVSVDQANLRMLHERSYMAQLNRQGFFTQLTYLVSRPGGCESPLWAGGKRNPPNNAEVLVRQPRLPRPVKTDQLATVFRTVTDSTQYVNEALQINTKWNHFKDSR